MSNQRNKLTAAVLSCAVASMLTCCATKAPKSEGRRPQREDETWEQALQRTMVEALVPRLRQAIQEHLGRPVKGIAIIASRDNLLLLSADLGGETKRLFASVYVENDDSYWKVEDFNESNRNLLKLLIEGKKEVEASDWKVDQRPLNRLTRRVTRELDLTPR